jgi:hypothetical protein
MFFYILSGLGKEAKVTEQSFPSTSLNRHCKVNITVPSGSSFKSCSSVIK